MRKAPTAELRDLVDRLLADGGLGRVETGRLEELLKDRDALRYYTEVMSQESMMAEALEGIEGEVRTVRFPWRAVAFAAAACVVFGLGFWSGRGGKAVGPGVVAKRAGVQVTGVMGVEWESAGAPEFAAGAVAAERVAFRSGLVELTYASGVRVTLEGPADFSVNDATSGRLENGKLVAYVPPGAEGFTVDYSKGRVVDLGTEFAMEVSGGKAEVGVFDGEIELHLPGDKPRPLFENQAVIHDDDVEHPLRPVPLDRGKFVRRMPARDFRWEITSTAPREIEFDVTHLIWKPSAYRAIFKWIDGVDAIVVSDVELRLDGEVVAADAHEGVSGVLRLVRENVYELDVDSGDFARGRWTLHAKVRSYPRELGTKDYTGPVMSQGILQFEEGLVSKASAGDFIGRWSYHHLGRHYVREFHEGGGVSLLRDGQPATEAFVGSHWEMEDGVLSVWIPDQQRYERHVLRDRRTLIFISNPYANAVRVESE